MFAVGIPIVRPRFAPWTTTPSTIPAPAEQALGRREIARAQVLRILRRRRDLAVDLDRSDDRDLDARAPAVRTQRVGRAGAALPVGEVVADDDRARATARASTTSSMNACGDVAGELARERLDHDDVGARFAEQLDAAIERRDHRRATWREQHATGADRTSARRSSRVRLGELARPRDQRAMADMHAVEVADRDRGAIAPGRRVLMTAKDLHRAGT